ncbi:MAG: TIGR04283 family arsenosugar biosynthesis glycosyltransferase [Caldimonas sp.]
MELLVVMPVLNEAASLAESLQALQPLRRRGASLIVVDGGSTDGSVEIADRGADRTLSAARGRASQMNAGAAAQPCRVMLFLHADTRLPDGAYELILAAIADGHAWGRFDVRIDSDRPSLRLVSWLINLRSRLTGIATGDQALFMTRAAFRAAGGFPALELMEDIEMSRRLSGLQAPPVCARAS